MGLRLSFPHLLCAVILPCFMASAAAHVSSVVPNVASSTAPTPASELTLTLPRLVTTEPEKYNFARDVLLLALSTQYQQLHIEYSHFPVSQGKAFDDFSKTQQRSDVFWGVTNQQREQQAYAIRFPIFKGLFGWRLLVSQDTAKSVDESTLRRARFLQGQHWPDVAVMRSNQLTVIESGDKIEQMYRLINADFADYFPRNILEIWPEYVKYQQQVAIDGDWLLYYSSLVYFFVSHENHELAHSIERGLQLIAADGRFERLFNAHFSRLIDAAKLCERRWLVLHNPDISADTLAQLQPLLYHPPCQQAPHR